MAFWDHNLEGEFGETYWTTLLLMYEKLHNYDHSTYHKKNHHTNMTKLGLRWHFRANAFSYEFSEWHFTNFSPDNDVNDDIIRSRDVPDMQTHFPAALERDVRYFFAEYGKQLGIDNQNDGEEVRQWLHNLLLEPQDTLFYCLHCKNQVEIMIINQQQQHHVCPRCGGWYLFERDPVYRPLLPTNWDLVCRRLTPDGQEFQQKQPPLRDDVIKEVDIRDLEGFDDSLCPICEVGSTCVNVAGKVIGKLPCGHIFHPECVSKWFDKTPDRRHCPKCRRLMPTVDPLFNIKLALIGMEEDYPPPLP